ncbi:MAG: lyase family protein [Candidatus Melainabacteria bacterium]|nr:lyase family protein [Candidatus Melainabacteria bacterium]
MIQRKAQQRNNQTGSSASRVEKDSEGEMDVPGDSYYGIGTKRLTQTIPQYGIGVSARLIEAMAQVKRAVIQSACSEKVVNESDFSSAVQAALLQACDEIAAGEFNQDIVVDGLAGASGHALNLNLGEIIANRAGEILGDSLGSYQKIQLEKHVDIASALEDIYPTSMRVAILLGLKSLKTILLDLERSLRRKSLEFESVVKLGRINLQDALPVTLGQEFNAYGSAVERALKRISEASVCLKEVNLGGTRVGTGFGVSHSFQYQVIQVLAAQTRLELRPADDYIKATNSMSDFLEFSSSLRELACDLVKMANDLAFLSSGPHGGLGEITLGASNLNDELSIAAYQVLANDQAVSLAVQGGKLQSNIFMPIIIHAILSSMQMLESSIMTFTANCLSRVKADPIRCRNLLENSEALLPVLAQELGMEKSVEVLSEAKKQKKSIKEVLFEQNLLPKDTLDRLTGYKYMTSAQR